MAQLSGYKTEMFFPQVFFLLLKKGYGKVGSMKINQDQHNFILIVAIVKMDTKPSMDNNLWINFF